MTAGGATVGATAPTYIGRGRGPLAIRWRELWSYRELLYFMVWRDIKVRYRHTVLGIAWALLQPLLTMTVFTIVFGQLARMPSDGQPYALFALAALTPWTYIVTAVTGGANALVGNEHLISKVYFPRLLNPAGAVLTPVIDLGVTLLLLAVALAWFGVVPGSTVVVLPLFMLLAGATALAASLWLSALNVLYRDVRFVVPFLLQFWMFASPVVYPASRVPEAWRFVYGLNPAATVIEGFRWALLGTELSAPMAAASVLSVTLALAGGLVYFRRMEGTFADVLEHALTVEGVGKQYRIGAPKPSYRTVRELIAGSASSLAARLRGCRPPRQPVPTIWALKDVSFDVRPGEVVGIIGGNGAGKSTLLKILSRITEPTEGGATVYGRVGSLLEVGTGFHPELTGRENVFLNGAILGMSRAHVASRFDAIVEFSGIGAFIDTAVRFYSSGMYVRLAFAVAAHMEPEILVVDEVLAVGDAEFQQRCLGKMNDVSRQGRTVLFVSHNLEALQRLCTRGLLLSGGRLIADGPVSTVVRRYREMTVTGADLGGFNTASRRGTGWAQFTDVRLMDGPVRTGRRAADDDLDLEMDVEVAGSGGGSLRGLLIEVVVSSGDGQPLCSLMTVDAGTALPDAASATIRLRIPGPVFIPGRYRVRVFLGIPFLQHVDEIDDALEFEIQPPRMPWRPYDLSPMRGHICVRGEWDTGAGRTPEAWALKPAAVPVDVQS